MRRYRFLDERKFRFLCEGLSLGTRALEVLDAGLVGLDEKNGTPSKILAHNQRVGFGPPPSLAGPQIVITLEARRSRQTGQTLTSAAVASDTGNIGVSPALHINLQSVALDIPQRVEIPLRYILKGLPDIESTFMVYLHVLRMEDGQNLVYYGITRRGWMKRFNEHISKALTDDSPLLFHRTMREGILGRLQQLRPPTTPSEKISPAKVMAGNHHVVCGAGLTEEQAHQTEEYLVEKYSFGKPDGLNMIPGGKAGIRYLHKLKIIDQGHAPTTDDEKESILERYIRANPRKGIPNALIASHWLNDEYATSVICAAESRLSVEQIRKAREAASDGLDASEICRIVNGKSVRQIKMLLGGRTYVRVK